MKQCTKCRLEKEEDYFYEDKRTKDGLYSSCKKCHLIRKGSRTGDKESHYYRQNPTPNKVARIMMGRIHSRVGNFPFYKNVRCYLSLSELEDYLAENWEPFMALHKDWEKNEFKRKFAPSVDRTDSKKHYSLDNIRIITVSDNSKYANTGLKRTKKQLEAMSRAVKARLKTDPNYFANSEMNKGERHPRVKLTLKQVLQIKEIFKKENPPTYISVASKYDVDPQTISNVVNNRRWRWL